MQLQKRVRLAARVFLASSIVLGLFVAMLSPNAVLTDSPILRAFTDFIASLIPSIDRLAKVSQFPEVTRLYLALLWGVWAPVWFVIFLVGAYPTPTLVMKWMNLAYTRWWYSLFFPPVAIWLAWGVATMPGIDANVLVSPSNPFQHIVTWMSHSRLWLGVFGYLFITFAACCVAGVLQSPALIRLSYQFRRFSPLYRKRDPKP